MSTNPKPSKGKAGIKAELVESSPGVGASTIAFYTFVVVTATLYGFFMFNPQQFESYEILKPVGAFFKGVEAYSPFHEFLNDNPQKEKVEEAKEVKAKPKEPFVERLFTKEELKAYDGSDLEKGPFLAVLGQVFDVSRGRDHYSPGSGYGFFSGIDGSRAFVSGEFNEKGLVDEVSGLSHSDYLGLKDWVEFYHKDYVYVGKVIGRFFDAQGRETPYAREVKDWIRAAEIDKEQKNEENKRFPSCNSEWSKSKGRRVWCTNKSGGIDRDWVGRPRKLFYSGRAERCACVRDIDNNVEGVNDLDNPNLKEYDGCDHTAASCQIEPPEPEEEL